LTNGRGTIGKIFEIGGFTSCGTNKTA